MDNEWKQYRRKGLSEMRPWTPQDGNRLALTTAGISVSEQDTPQEGGMIARNPKDHSDQWYVAPEYFKENLELV